MPLGIDPTVDYAFKKLFGDPNNGDLLIHLLNAVLTPTSPIVEVEILNPFNEKEFAEDKLSVLDVKARDASRAWFNIEMQSNSPGLLRQRLPYYNASLFVDQLVEGQHYRDLLPAISICFLEEVLISETEAPHLTFMLDDCRHGVRLSDCLQIHTIELPKYNFTKSMAHAGSLASADHLAKWAYFLSRAADHEAAELQRWLPEPAYRKATGVVEMIARTPEQRMQYEARRKAEMDFKAFTEEAMEEGFKRGRLEGEQKGEQKGELRGRKWGLAEQIRLLQNLLGDAVLPEPDLLAMDLEPLSRLCDELKSRLPPAQ